MAFGQPNQADGTSPPAPGGQSPGSAGFPGKAPTPAASQGKPQPAKAQPLKAQPLPASGRPPISAGPGRPISAEAARANRPIPIKQRKAGDLPEGYEEEDDSSDLAEVARNAPAWLVSTIFHVVILIFLGLWTYAVQQNHEVVLEAAISHPESIETQLEDDSVLFAPKNQLEKADKTVITPQNLPPVDDPFATPPELTDISLGGTAIQTDIQAPTIGLALTGRTTGMKNVLLAAYGGNATTEGAVGKGLAWLAKQQRADGSWSLAGPYKDGTLDDNVPAATAMALLAFQGNGNTHRVGKYAKAVERGWNALLKLQDRDGYFGRQCPSRQGLYAHAQCTIALCEVYGMTKDSRFYDPAQRAIAHCVKIQDRTGGGWRYEPGVDSDTSVTGWFVMALQSARMARLEVPQETLDNVTRYLDSVALSDNTYAYTKNSYPTPAVTAEAFLCREYLGWKQDDPRLVSGCEAIARKGVIYAQGDQDVYCWYYATQACHHIEGEIWKTWNASMAKEVPAKQVTEGPETGSWNPQGDKWGTTAGRLYTTCLSIYMLEVYYRHLPIYSGYRFKAE